MFYLSLQVPVDLLQREGLFCAEPKLLSLILQTLFQLDFLFLQFVDLLFHPRDLTVFGLEFAVDFGDLSFWNQQRCGPVRLEHDLFDRLSADGHVGHCALSIASAFCARGLVVALEAIGLTFVALEQFELRDSKVHVALGIVFLLSQHVDCAISFTNSFPKCFGSILDGLRLLSCSLFFSVTQLLTCVLHLFAHRG